MISSPNSPGGQPPPMDSWFVEAQQPVLPDPVHEQPDSFDFTVAPQHFPVDSESWKGEAPERIDDLRPVQHPESFDYTFRPGDFAIPEESWRGFYPDHIDDLKPVQQPEASGEYVFTASGAFPELSWLGYQPATIDDIPREEYLFEWHAWHTDTPVVDVAPSMDSWFMEAQLPTIETQPEQPESIFYVINPADFVIPPIVGPCPPGSGAFRTFEGFRAYCGF